MPNANYIKYYVFISGILVKTGGLSITSAINTLASCQISIDYSPHIIHLPKYTSICVFSSNGSAEPQLEFDGVIVGINYSKSIMSGHSVTLSCFTAGIIWNARRQIDFTLNELAAIIKAGSPDVLKQGIGGGIDNYYSNAVKSNGYDIGAAGACMLTSTFTATASTGIPNAYTFIYNGKSLRSDLNKVTGNDTSSFLNPPFYSRFLNNFKLQNKMYGISTTNTLKSYFNYSEFFDAITGNTYTDLHGENTFWQIAANTWMIGYHEVIDIPNATFIAADENAKSDPINLTQYKLNGESDSDTTINSFIDATNVSKTLSLLVTNKNNSGLAEYIIKPRSIFGLPMKCNVIWPDQVLEFSILKDFLNEVTRTRCIRNAIPGVSDEDFKAFVSSVVVGPNFKDSDNYFTSFNSPNIDPNQVDQSRTEQSFSAYEKQFGAINSDLQLNDAYNAALYNDTDDSQTKLEKANDRIKIFTNYEFAQKYFKIRACSITVNNEVDVIPGFPIVILNESGQHLIAYCISKVKSWQAGGNSSTTLEIGYPRYINEKIGSLAQAVDPLSYDSTNTDATGELKQAISELEAMLGTQRILVSGSPTTNIDIIESAINDIFTTYNKYTDSDIEILKNSYKRKVCKFSEYTNFYLNKPLNYSNGSYKAPDPLFINQDMDQLIQDQLDSPTDMANLSCNRYTIYDRLNGTLEEIKGLRNSQIIQLHKNFVDNTANRV